MCSKNQLRKQNKFGYFGVRHLQALLMFFCLTFAYGMRVNLSVAIVAMTDRHSANPGYEDFEWDESIQSVLLSSFFLGYVVTQIPAGQLSERYGSRLLMLFAMIFCSLLTILTPFCSSFGGWKALCVLRVLEGLCQGVLCPSIHNLLSKWAPISERAHLVTYTYSGSQFGTVVMLSLSGLLASSAMGWPSIFYFSGAASGIWSIVWFFFGCNSPADYKNISAQERQFIEATVPIEGEKDAVIDKKNQTIKTPWVKIFTSAPFFALIVVHSAHNWGFWTLLTKLPTYMKNILEFDIKKNALLSALPYFAMMITSYFFSYLSNVLQNKKCIPLNLSRKLFNTIGHWIPMIALIGLAYVPSSQSYLAVSLLVVTVGINSATYLGFQCNHIDLAPNFAGTLMGLTNCAANIMSIVAPLIVGIIVKNEKSIEQWRIVFFISAGVYFFGNLLFILFSKTDVQEWNYEPPLKPNTNENDTKKCDEIEDQV